MNFRRGLLRLWIVVSLIWSALVVVGGIAATWADWKSNTPSGPKIEPAFCAALPPTPPWCKYQFGWVNPGDYNPPSRQSPDCAEATRKELTCLGAASYGREVSGQRLFLARDIGLLLAALFVPILALYAAGRCTLWIIAGFRGR